MVFENPEFDNHERVAFITDGKCRLSAINVVHRTRHGTAGGGIRCYPYRSSTDAVTDALRLSRAMSHKLALAALPAGGAKTVVIGDPAVCKTDDLLRSLGRFIESMGGAYLGGPDVGTNRADMEVIAKETSYVAGRGHHAGSTAEPTAVGVFNAMRAVAKFAFGADTVAGLSVVIQGAGGVGSHLCRLLTNAGAVVRIADIADATAKSVAEETGAEVIGADAALSTAADILSPCALGAVLNKESIARLNVRAICGAANNQIATEADGDRLAARGIAFAPDYVVSSGGAISGFLELGFIDATQYDNKLQQIYDTTLKTLELAHTDGISTETAALKLAQQILQSEGDG